jgi:hypothetical protein
MPKTAVLETTECHPGLTDTEEALGICEVKDVKEFGL